MAGKERGAADHGGAADGALDKVRVDVDASIVEE